MRRITLVLAIAGVAGGCGGADSGSDGGLMESRTASSSGSGSTGGGTATALAINGGAASGPAIGGRSVSVPSAGAGGSTSGPSAGKGGAVSLPAVGSSVGGGSGMLSCSQVAAYATTLKTPPKCAACLESSCCGALLGCYDNLDCLTYAQCVSSCNGSSASNSSPNCGCDSKYPNGMSDFDQYAQCVFASCKSECVTITVTGNPPPGSSSGGASCQSPGAPCTQKSDCCSNLCNTSGSSGATVNYCQ
jgi:hypothetical protein